MSLSEKRVLKKLSASSFSNLSVEQLKMFTDLIPDMDNELVKAAMNSFSNFRFMSLVMVGYLQDKLYRVCKQRTNSQRKFFAQTDAALKNLDSVLRAYKGTEEERNTVEDAIIQIAYTMSPFVAGVIRRMKNGLGYAAVALGILASLAVLAASVMSSDSSEGGSDSDSDSDSDSGSGSYDYDDDYDDDEYEERISVYDAVDIWLSSGMDEDYTCGYSEDELRRFM